VKGLLPVDLLLFLILIVVGYYLGKKLHFPLPSLLGPLTFLAVINLLGLKLTLWPYLKSVFSIILGAFLGLRFTIQSKEMAKIALLLSFWMILTALGLSQLLVLQGIDLPTAMFASSPGGLAEMGVTAMSFGANPFQVTLLQTARLLTILFMVPLIAQKYQANKCENGESETAPSKTDWGNPAEWFKISLVAFSAAIICHYAEIPAPDLVGPLFAVFFYTRLYPGRVKPVEHIQHFGMMGVGGLIGLGVTRETLLEIPSLLGPALVLSSLTLLSGIVLALVLKHYAKWDLVTCLLAAAPAGTLPMTLLACEMGADAPKVAVMQIIRLFTVVAVSPFVFTLFL
jgi:hypothetical protein